MKRSPSLMIRIIFWVVILAACAPASSEGTNLTESPSQPPTETESPATIEPLTPTSEPATETSVLVPVTGPLMEVGSTYSYVDGAVLLAVPEGEFIMGANGSDSPEHLVTLSGFWIYSTEVTNQQYALCVRLGGCTLPDSSHNFRYYDIDSLNDPVVGVNFEQAVAYCSFVHARLPTEAEWEKVARGPEGNVYPWGDTDPSCDLLNFFSCNGRTTNVLNYPKGASYYGALNMAGNAYEWVADWYDAGYYENSPKKDPLGPENGTMKSVRSSGYKTEAKDTGVVIRHSYDPQEQHSDLGFRCVVDEPRYFAAYCQTPLVYADTAAAASSETCPVVRIKQSPQCVKKLPLTKLEFEGPDGAAMDPGVCAPTGDPKSYTCLGTGLVSISASCEVEISGDPACASGYSLEDSTCKANVTEGACLQGMEYDSTQGCCAIRSQTETLSLLPVCPVGTYYVAGREVCASIPLHGIISVIEPIDLKDINECTNHGSNQPATSCVPPSNGCGYRMVWDSAQCKCVAWEENP